MLYDVRKMDDYPIQVFEHQNVRGLEFCPVDNKLLATGGRDGVKVWNMDNGDLESTMPIPGKELDQMIATKEVTSLLWSPYNKEVMASYDNYLSIWSLSSSGKSHHLKEWRASPSHHESSTVISMDHLPNGRVVSLNTMGTYVDWFHIFERRMHRKDVQIESSFTDFQIFNKL